MENQALTETIIGCAMKVHSPANEVQLVNYLTATGIEIGLLLNFGAERLEFKRKARTYRPKQPPKDFIR